MNEITQEITIYDIIKDIKFITEETGAIHTYDSKYVKFEPRGKTAGYLRNEDMDETKREKPDYDYDEPITYIELYPNKFKITIIKYGGKYHTSIYYKEQLLFAGVGGLEQRHRGGYREVQLIPEAKPPPDLGTVVNLLNEIKNILTKQQLPPTHLYYHKDDIDTPTIEGKYLEEHDINLYAILGRNAPVLYVYNDGPGDIYFVFSTNGVDFSVEESLIYPGERQIIYNIYWIRLRTNVAGTFYRLSEYPVERPDKVSISQTQNLAIPIINSSFEQGTLEGWSYTGNGKVEIDNINKNTGNYSAKITVNPGGTIDLYNNEIIPIIPKRSILISGYVQADNVSKVYFLVRYLTEDGNQLPHPACDNIAYEALYGYDKYLEGLQPTKFTRKLRETSAPPGAAFYQVGIRVIAKPDSPGTAWLDDLSLPTFLDIEPQFYWKGINFITKTRYLLPGESIILHSSEDGETGDIWYFEITVSSKNALFTLTLDNEEINFPLSVLLNAAQGNITGAYLVDIYDLDPDPLKHRYQVVLTPREFKYNYRQKVTLSNPQYVLEIKVQEQIATGDGTTKTFTGTLANPVIYMGTLTITDGNEVFIDNANGTLTGTKGGSGIINYYNGAYSITFNTAPPNGVKIYTSYYYLYPNTQPMYFRGGAIYKRIRI